jgi:hypothetical protein
MKITINGRLVEVLNERCRYRPCLHAHEWRGYIVQGQGYKYAPRSLWRWICIYREDRGCPDPIPEPDPERARCCNAPRVRKVKPDQYGRRPHRQRCLFCGVWLTGFPLELARTAEEESE